VDYSLNHWNQIVSELKKWQELKTFGTADLRLENNPN
jgi:hypothetical protein